MTAPLENSVLPAVGWSVLDRNPLQPLSEVFLCGGRSAMVVPTATEIMLLSEEDVIGIDLGWSYVSQTDDWPRPSPSEFTKGDCGC